MNVLYATEGLMHPTKKAQKLVKSYLDEYFDDENSVKHINTGDIPKENLSEYDAVVLYYHTKEDNNAVINHIEDYVANGGNVIGIHGVCASYKKSKKWFEVFGGKFVSHPPVGEVHIGEDKIMDEMYSFELINPKIMIESRLDDNCEPCIWVNKYKSGTAYYFALGHDDRAVKSPVFKKYLFKTLDYWRNDNG